MMSKPNVNESAVFEVGGSLFRLTDDYLGTSGVLARVEGELERGWQL